MAARAAEQLHQERAAEDATWAAQRAKQERQEQERYQAEFETGPPEGCRDCYEWVRHKFGGWYWEHLRDDDIEWRPVTERSEVGDDWTYETRICHHPCHGPDGEDIGPIIALASAS
jgi:hypothetical protein